MADNARDVALDVLRRVETQGAFASAALRAALDQRPDLDPKERGLATELVYGVLRRRGQLDRAISARGKRLKDLDPKLHDVLRLAAYQMIFLDRVPDHAAVNAAVEQARLRGGQRASSQANAILRALSRLERERRLPDPPDAKTDPAGHLAAFGSLSRPLAERLLADFGLDRSVAFARSSLEQAPLVLRANRLAITREALAEEVRGTPGAHLQAVHLPEGSSQLPADLPAVVEGRATVQDEGSMRIVDLLGASPGERILDVCASPGGKTTAIAEVMGDGGMVVAHDRTPEKLERVRRSAERLHLASIEIAEVLPALDDPPFDRVIVDAPCSGLGTLRRHPEIRWRFRAGDLERLALLQENVLRAGASRVRPGGTLVYAVCTITRAETEERIAGLEGFEIAEALRTDPADPGSPDAFFGARLVRR